MGAVLVLWILAVLFGLMAVTSVGVFILVVWIEWTDRRRGRMRERQFRAALETASNGSGRHLQSVAHRPPNDE